jgi:hypothetical protein
MVNSDESANATNPHLSECAGATSAGIWNWAFALLAGLVAGMVAWAVGEATFVPEAAVQSNREEAVVLPVVAGIRNGSISFGTLGAALGFGLGLAGGMIGRSVPRAVIAGATGMLLGGGAGVALTRMIVPVYYGNVRSGDMIYSLMVHGGVWVAIGAAAGLAFAIGVGGAHQILRGLLGGGAAALLATFIYEFAGAILFPTALTDRPISQTWSSRLLARLLVSILVAAGVILSAGLTSPRKSGMVRKPEQEAPGGEEA